MNSHRELIELYMKKEALIFYPHIKNDDLDQCIQTSTNYFNGLINFEEAKDIITKLCGNAKIIERIGYLLSVGLSTNNISSNYFQDAKKNRRALWTEIEDSLLIFAVLHYGIEDWNLIAQHVSGKTPSQCYQRWSKVLDPRFSQDSWTQEEDEKLCNAVKIFGEKNWQKISSAMGSRSDSQCRIRFKKLSNKSVIRERSFEACSQIKSKVNPSICQNKRRNSITIASFLDCPIIPFPDKIDLPSLLITVPNPN